MVALVFAEKKPVGYEIDHIDCNKLNNVISNLEYVSHKENVRRAHANGLCDYSKYNIANGSAIGSSKLTEEQVVEIKKRLLSGDTGVAISKDYGVSRDAISCIKMEKTWKHITI